MTPPQDLDETATHSPVRRTEVGRLRWFDEERAYGFIESPSGQDRFLHHSELLFDPAELGDGSPLEFKVRRGERGPLALRARPLRLPPFGRGAT